MSEQKNQQSNSEGSTPTASGGYQTPLEDSIRKTGDAEKSDARETAKPEAPGEDNVAGSPNQGTESR
ncbi:MULTISPECIES: hypothetical protein [unclassified Tolypothrix]|uniref:hypothetical protein n=1 Tax=unclassified Tolypothrix TaxID=2649714 RepID=UPI0005EABA98|nr:MULTISPECIES: hypothetical protein [unclassified Tolypothrix]BAY90627.1 hypothetical protein NIES3275_26440 [Microchaete diplosiphon NIES-3275]EKF01209.1 hypothetical protein FDUTEX481_08089 [Tolypothrix sp. PCC 7601]MBE9086104.1 hypothetical protein [Tolypothrix sp. LEGE 11397]UYD24779.1 hypothetical protein HGR01_25630 [Tolypothrix sp. PCC 7712]UYD32990.1 hypothetical protein HG267_29020 [Tolypothrix sp. PCC 7601]